MPHDVDIESGKIDWRERRRANCKAAYITLSETVSTKKEGSMRYGDVTRTNLAPYPVFILKDSRSKTGDIQVGEWERFVEFVSSDAQN